MGTSMTSPDISVIVPVLNKAPYLRDCLDSVLAQSLSTIEVICIDDGSVDGSAEILGHYARRDPRLTLLRNEITLGPGTARNMGIEVARGRYVQFTDADDMMSPGALETLHQRIASDEVELVRGMVAWFFTDKPEQLTLANPIEDRRHFPPLDYRELWVPWWHHCYLISRSFLARNEIRYPGLLVGEDPVFIASCLVRAEYISTVARVTYHYRVQPSGQEKDRTSFAHFQSYLHHAAMVKDIFLKHKAECWTEGYGPYILEHLKTYLDVCKVTGEQGRDAQAALEGLST
jgi:glycosyltransferase involved in cell wall biosynthesis